MNGEREEADTDEEKYEGELDEERKESRDLEEFPVQEALMAVVADADTLLGNSAIDGQVLSEPLLNKHSKRGRSKTKDERREPAYVHAQVRYARLERDRGRTERGCVDRTPNDRIASCLGGDVLHQLYYDLLGIHQEIFVRLDKKRSQDGGIKTGLTYQ